MKNHCLKYVAPKCTPHFIHNEDTFKDLDLLLETRHIFISAGPGYGKTTLSKTWLEAKKKSYIWINLSKEDNSLEKFQTHLNYILANYQEKSENEMVFVFDNFNTIEDNHVLTHFYEFIEQIPSSQKVILISSCRPIRQFMELVLKNRFALITQSDLAFNFEMTKKYLNLMNHCVSDSKILEIMNDTNGWILAIHAICSMDTSQIEDSDFSENSIHEINEYFRYKIWESLDTEHKEFLLKTSMLDILNAPLCNIVMGNQSSSAFIDNLYQNNYFISKMCNSYYRYDNLFRNFLREEFCLSDYHIQKQTYKNMADWFLKNGMSSKAIVFYLSADQMKEAEDLVFYNRMGISAYAKNIRLLVKKAPINSPVFTLQRSWLSYVSGAVDEMLLWIRRFEDMFIDSELIIKNNLNLFFLHIRKGLCPQRRSKRTHFSF